MFVWIFHRVSGLILIVAIGFKIVTGYGILGRYGNDHIETMRALHRALHLDLLLTFLFIYHALYGLRTCLVDLGVRRERQLFWSLSILGAILYMLVVWFILLPHGGS